MKKRNTPVEAPVSKRVEACREKIKALLKDDPLMSLNQIAAQAKITARAAKLYTDQMRQDLQRNKENEGEVPSCRIY